MQIKLSISPSHSILTPGQPVPALTLYRQVPGRVATGVPFFFLSHGMTQAQKNPGASGIRTRDLPKGHKANEAVSKQGPPRWPSSKSSASKATDLGSIPTFAVDLCPRPWLPCQTPGVTGSELGLVIPLVSIPCVDEIESLIWNICLGVAARTTVSTDPTLRYTSMLLGRKVTDNKGNQGNERKACLWMCAGVCVLDSQAGRQAGRQTDRENEQNVNTQIHVKAPWATRSTETGPANMNDAGPNTGVGQQRVTGHAHRHTCFTDGSKARKLTQAPFSVAYLYTTLSTKSRLLLSTASLALWLKRPLRERKIRGSNPACARTFPGLSHTSDLKIGTPVATLPYAWRYRVSAGTGWPGVSIL